jgi:hypothetical protein
MNLEFVLQFQVLLLIIAQPRESLSVSLVNWSGKIVGCQVYIINVSSVTLQLPLMNAQSKVIFNYCLAHIILIINHVFLIGLIKEARSFKPEFIETFVHALSMS